MKLQALVEEKVGFLIVFTFIVISIGLLVEVVPLFFTKEGQTLYRAAIGRARHLYP